MIQQAVRGVLSLVALSIPQLVLAAKFSEYILAPRERIVQPISVHTMNGYVVNSHGLLSGRSAQTNAVLGHNSSVTLDFGLNIGGTVAFEVSFVSTPNSILAVSFTESPLYISPYHCDGGYGDWDDPLVFQIDGPGSYASDKAHQRGGFRYATLWHNSSGTISIQNFSVNFTAAPEMVDLRDYSGWFNCDSEKLNRVWYAGAYTNQMCTSDPKYGNTLFIGGTNWYTNYTVANGTSVLLDGAKRDRLVWPGDMIVSTPSVFVATNSLDGTRNALDSLFLLQDSQGRLPTSGKPFSTFTPSFFFGYNYHLYTLQSLHLYYLYTGDVDYLKSYWTQFQRAMAYSVGTIDKTGMGNVTSNNDWGRFGMGGHNIEANAVLYQTLRTAIQVAEAVGDTRMVMNWTSAMHGIKIAVNEKLWDPAENLFFDNDTSQGQQIHPQDGNTWAILSGLVSDERATAISESLMKRWVRPYGAPAPECGTAVSPFITSLEIRAHFMAGLPERAIDIIEWMWADFMLDDPRMTNSTLVEGYSTDGAIHYPPYADIDQRISHSHGWASGPTSALTFYVAGLQIVSPGGGTWHIQPQLGGLQRATAGYQTPMGEMSATWKQENGCLTGAIETPRGTFGTLVLPQCERTVIVEGDEGNIAPSVTTGTSFTYPNLPGAVYRIYYL